MTLNRSSFSPKTSFRTHYLRISLHYGGAKRSGGGPRVQNSFLDLMSFFKNKKQKNFCFKTDEDLQL
jgi:hypothetical protein